MAKQEKTEKQHNLAGMFKALGDPMRLRVFLFLRARSGDSDTSPTVTDVSRNVAGSKKIPSKVSRALKELRVAGLVTIERQGKNLLCGIHRDAVAALAECFGAIPDLPAAPMLDVKPIAAESKNGASAPVRKAPTQRTSVRRKTRTSKDTDNALSQDKALHAVAAGDASAAREDRADEDPALELVAVAK